MRKRNKRTNNEVRKKYIIKRKWGCRTIGRRGRGSDRWKAGEGKDEWEVEEKGGVGVGGGGGGGGEGNI